MTRKDYEQIAAAIKATLRRNGVNDDPYSDTVYGVTQAADELARTFQKDNPLFDRERFSRACGLPR